MTIIGRQIVIDGEVSSDEDLTIEGRVRGYVTVRDATLIIDAPGRVEADLRAARIVVQGVVEARLRPPNASSSAPGRPSRAV